MGEIDAKRMGVPKQGLEEEIPAARGSSEYPDYPHQEYVIMHICVHADNRSFKKSAKTILIILFTARQYKGGFLKIDGISHFFSVVL